MDIPANSSLSDVASAMSPDDDSLLPFGRFFIQQYHYIFHYDADQRVENWFLMRSPWPTILFSIFYVYGCCWLGPLLMKKRKPWKLRRVIMFYNAFQVLFSAWIFSMSVRGGWFISYNVRCQPIDTSNSKQATIMLHMMWWYFFSKYVDFLDTVFFILRKKYNHVSFLHIGHHGGMPFACWYFLRFMPGGHITSLHMLNSFVHTVMYFYYFLAGLGPRVQKFLWWKRYLTILQMVQFVLIVIHQSQLLFSECNYPRYQCYWGVFFGSWIFLLFLQFYLDNYKDHTRPKVKRSLSVTVRLSSYIPCHNMAAMESDFMQQLKEDKADMISNGRLNGTSTNSLRLSLQTNGSSSPYINGTKPYMNGKKHM